MGTTTNGLPYPEGTDLVADGAAAIQALAEAIDPAAADSGWADWKTGVPSGYTIRVRTIGPVCWVNVAGTASVPEGATTIATGLPAAPPSAWAFASLANYPGGIAVSTAGNCLVRNQTGAARANCNALYSYTPTTLEPVEGQAVLGTLEAEDGPSWDEVDPNLTYNDAAQNTEAD